MTFVCKELDVQILNQTATQWELLCNDSDEFAAKYQDTFNLAVNNINYNDKSNSQTLFYGVFDETNLNEAVAILETIKSKKNKNNGTTKLLELRMSPALLGNNQKLFDVYTISIEKIFNLMYADKNNIIKIYGRNSDLRVFLSQLYDSLLEAQSKGRLQGVEIKMQDRWLVFEFNRLSLVS